MPGCISPPPPQKKYQFVDVKKQNVLFILDEDKTPKSSETKMFFRRFFQDKKIFFLIIHLFFLSGSCKTCTSDVVISVLCCKLPEILDLRKIKHTWVQWNTSLQWKRQNTSHDFLQHSSTNFTAPVPALYLAPLFSAKIWYNKKMLWIFVFSKSWAEIFLRNRS